MLEYDWELTKSPAGKNQLVAKNAPSIIPDAYDPNKKHPTMMLTADLAFKFDHEYSKIARKFLENPQVFEEAFSKAWFKLIHRDMGPIECYLGVEVPKEVFLWQDPLPKRDFELIDEEDIKNLKEKILSSNFYLTQLIYIAWSSASSYRDSDKKGGANGAWIRLKPMNSWEVNHPKDLEEIISFYENIQKEFNGSQRGGKKVSIADLIVLGGCSAIEESAKKAGFDIKVPFVPGRVDATQDLIDVDFNKELEPFAEGFRNYIKDPSKARPEYLLIDKAQLLKLTVPELTALNGGLRALGVNYNYNNYGVLTKEPGVLTNSFFVNLLDMDIEWKGGDENSYIFFGYDKKTSKQKWTATRVDLIFGHNVELRSVCEVYASRDGKEKFLEDFVKVWHKIMMLDRFDLKL